MVYDATLKSIFRLPPNLLLSLALGKRVVVKRPLPTDAIVVHDLEPDLLYEDEDGKIIHAETHGYGLKSFTARNLVYFAIINRDYAIMPRQIVFWVGKGPVGVDNGLDCDDPDLRYRFRMVDARSIVAKTLVESGNVGEAIFAILCKYDDAEELVDKICARILSELPPDEQRDAVAKLLVLSGLRDVTPVVKEKLKRMPIAIDIHENAFLDEIWKQGEAKGESHGRLVGARETLRDMMEMKFGPLPDSIQARIEAAPDLDQIKSWSRRVLHAAALASVFDD